MNWMKGKRDRLILAAALAGGVAFGLGLGMDDARAGAEIKVGMAGSTFGPKAVTAKVGDTINFVNDDTENHWVYTAKPGMLVSRAGIRPGDNFKLDLAKAGTFEVLCGLHSAMTMTITVKK